MALVPAEWFAAGGDEPRHVRRVPEPAAGRRRVRGGGRACPNRRRELARSAYAILRVVPERRARRAAQRRRGPVLPPARVPRPRASQLDAARLAALAPGVRARAGGHLGGAGAGGRGRRRRRADRRACPSPSASAGWRRRRARSSSPPRSTRGCAGTRRRRSTGCSSGWWRLRARPSSDSRASSRGASGARRRPSARRSSRRARPRCGAEHAVVGVVVEQAERDLVQRGLGG